MFHDDTAGSFLPQVTFTASDMQFFNERYHDYLTLVSLDQNNELAEEARRIVAVWQLKRGCRR